MSSGHSSSSKKLMQAALKQRVKDLEVEVGELKTKLDQLRKAKSTTIVKRKLEVIYVGGEIKRQSQAHEVDKLSSTGPSHSQTNEETTGIDEEPSVSVLSLRNGEKKEATASQDECAKKKDQEDSIRKLFRRISELNDENIALKIENKDLVCKVAKLTSELSVNEVKMCEREEKMKVEISAEWRQKYDSWMEEMEKKMSELNLKRD